MGKVDDYINSLDGQENLDVTEVARNLLELHNEEIGISNAKIQTMQGALIERDATIAEKDSALTKQMAKNWELANQIPVDDAADTSAGRQTAEKPEPGRIGFDDVLFASKDKD